MQPIKDNILITSRGTLEDKIIKHLMGSEKVEKVYAPNVDIHQTIESEHKLVNCDVSSDDFKGMAQFYKDQKIYFAIALDEDQLRKGIVDEFTKEKLKIFGPSKKLMEITSNREKVREFLDNSMSITKAEPFGTNKVDGVAGALEYIQNYGGVFIKSYDREGEVYHCKKQKSNKATETAVKEAINKMEGGYLIEQALSESSVRNIYSIFMLTGGGILHLATMEYEEKVRGGVVLPKKEDDYKLADITSQASSKIINSIILHFASKMRDEKITYRGFLCLDIKLNIARSVPLLSDFYPTLPKMHGMMILERMQQNIYDYFLACTTGRFSRLEPITWKG